MRLNPTILLFEIGQYNLGNIATRIPRYLMCDPNTGKTTEIKNWKPFKVIPHPDWTEFAESGLSRTITSAWWKRPGLYGSFHKAS